MSAKAGKSPRGPRPRTARELAVHALLRARRDGAFVAAVLDAQLAELDERERRFATELSYGSLRVLGALERRLAELAPRGLGKLDPEVRAELVVAAYQILFLDKVPSYAAVDAAVGALKQRRGARLAGFANALLRRLSDQAERPSLEQAMLESAPPWLVASLDAAFGREETLHLLGARGEIARQAVRLVGPGPFPDWLAAAPRGRWSAVCRVPEAGGDLRQLEGFERGQFVVQEQGAQLIALALGARAGERVLDACAGRGQKSSLLSERVTERGELWATDLHANKLEALAREFARLSLPVPRTRALDLASGYGDLPTGFDRVLVDAPCTGVGTLRHRPEIALRLKEEDPGRLAALSLAITRSAAQGLKPGGRLVFAVCSVLEEECEAVVRALQDVLEPAPFEAEELSPLLPRGASSFRLLPGRHGTDGYFVASFCRPS